MRFSFSRVIPLSLAALVLTGAGCSLGGSSSGTAGPTATDGGVFRTVDAGDRWTQPSAVPTAKGVGTLSGANVTSLENDPQDGEAWYLGTRENGLFYSIDGMASWQRPRLEVLRDGPIADVEVDAKNTCTVYVAREQRLFKTTDCLRTFDQDTLIETRPNVRLTDMVVDWYNPNVLWVGESNGDVQKSVDGGRTWRRVLTNSTAVTSILLNPTDSRMAVVGTLGNGFYRTTDSGATWTQIQSELKKLRGAATVAALATSAKAELLVAATDYGLLSSLDFGATWEPVQLLTSPGQVKIQALSVRVNSAERIIAYASIGTFYRSLDGGKNWTTHQLTTARTPTRLAPDPKAPAGYFMGVAAPVKK